MDSETWTEFRLDANAVRMWHVTCGPPETLWERVRRRPHLVRRLIFAGRTGHQHVQLTSQLNAPSELSINVRSVDLLHTLKVPAGD